MRIAVGFPQRPANLDHASRERLQGDQVCDQYAAVTGTGYSIELSDAVKECKDNDWSVLGSKLGAREQEREA